MKPIAILLFLLPALAQVKPVWEFTPSPEPGPSLPEAKINVYLSRVVANYYLQLPNGYCVVNVLENDRGLSIAASKNVAEEKMHEMAFILSGIGLTNMQHYWRKGGIDDFNRNTPIPEWYAPRIFQQLCAGYTKDLPVDVRRKFQGIYGIK